MTNWQKYCIYLQSCIQSLRYIKFLELLVVFGQMLFHWFADKIIILWKKKVKKKEFTEASQTKLVKND